MKAMKFFILLGFFLFFFSALPKTVSAEPLTIGVNWYGAVPNNFNGFYPYTINFNDQNGEYIGSCYNGQTGSPPGGCSYPEVTWTSPGTWDVTPGTYIINLTNPLCDITPEQSVTVPTSGSNGLTFTISCNTITGTILKKTGATLQPFSGINTYLHHESGWDLSNISDSGGNFHFSTDPCCIDGLFGGGNYTSRFDMPPAYRLAASSPVSSNPYGFSLVSYGGDSRNIIWHLETASVSAVNRDCSASGDKITISWSNNASPVTSIDFSTSSTFASGAPIWRKIVSAGTTSTTFPTGFIGFQNATGQVADFTGGYFRVNAADGTLGEVYTAQTYNTPCFSASCSVNPTSIVAPGNVTFTGTAANGSGWYTYTWTGDVSGSTSNTQQLTDSKTRAYTTADVGARSATVTINSMDRTVDRFGNVVSSVRETKSATCNLTVNAPPPAGSPNLVAINLASSPSGANPTIGSTLNFTGNIKNNATDPSAGAGASNARYCIVPNSEASSYNCITDSSKRLGNDLPVGSLAANATSPTVNSASWTVSAPPTGSTAWTVILCADAGNVVAEGSAEGDNCAVLNLTPNSEIPNTPTITSKPSCLPAAGARGTSDVVISWVNKSMPITRVDITTTGDATTYSRQIFGGATSTTAPGGFFNSSNTELTLFPNTSNNHIYTVKTFNGTNSSAATTFSVDTACANPLTGTCSVSNSNPTVGQPVTWTVTMSGGTLPFNYEWYDQRGISLDSHYGINSRTDTMTLVYNTPGTGVSTLIAVSSLNEGKAINNCPIINVTGSTPLACSFNSNPSVNSYTGMPPFAPGQTFDLASTSTGSISSYEWSVNGGPPIGSSSTNTWTPNAPGKYTVNLKVSDNTGASQNCNLQIRVTEVSGYVWIDTNENRVKDGAEQFYTGGAQVHSTNAWGTASFIANVASDGNGQYKIGAIGINIPGSLDNTQVYFDLPSGYRATTGTSAVASCQFIPGPWACTVNFGIVQATVTPPNKPFVSQLAPCITGRQSGTDLFNIQWVNNGTTVDWVDISSDINFSTYYHKGIPNASDTSTTAPNGFNDASGALFIEPDTAYYARTYNTASGQTSSISDAFLMPKCFDFEIIRTNAATTPRVIFKKNTSSTDYISVIKTAGSSRDVKLQIISLPSGVTASFVPNASYNVNPDGTINGITDYIGILTIASPTINQALPFDTFITIKGTGTNELGNLEKYATIPITIQDINAPSDGSSWIQTQGGDVHSNTEIITPGGPPQ
jgi:hypothetical protein